MTIPTVSNQGFTDKKHISGIFTLSHSKGAPQTSGIGRSTPELNPLSLYFPGLNGGREWARRGYRPGQIPDSSFDSGLTGQ
jgi:hypothetical protein